MKLSRKVKWGFLAIVVAIASIAYAHTNTSTLGRLEIVWPDLGYDAGAGLESVIHTAVSRISDNMNSRYEEFTAIADSTLSTHDHNFNVAFSELSILLYNGIGASKTRIADPAGAGWTIAAGSGDPLTEVDITTPGSGGPRDFTVIVTIASGVESIDDLDDVDITTTAPEDGQALVWDSAGSEFIPGASGDSSFKCQAITDPNLTLKGGALILDDGRELLTYDGAGSASTDFGVDITVNLDTVLGSAPTANTTYYLYIDNDTLAASPTVLTDNGREVYAVEEANFDISTDAPEDRLLERYVPICFIRSATAATSWDGVGSSFDTTAFRRHDNSPPAAVPIVFSRTDTVTTYGGTTGTIVHNKDVEIAKQIWYAVVDDGSVQTQLSASDWITDKTADQVSYDFTGLAGSDTVTVYLKDTDFSSRSISSQTFNTGELTAAPSFPLAHGLPSRPLEVTVWTEGQTTASQWDDRTDLCSADQTNLNCDFSSLTIGASNKIQIVASLVPGGSALRCAAATVDGNMCQTAQTFSGNKTFSGVTDVSAGLTVETNLTNADCTAGGVCSGDFNLTENVGSRVNINSTALPTSGNPGYLRVGDEYVFRFTVGINCSAAACDTDFNLPFSISAPNSQSGSGSCSVAESGDVWSIRLSSGSNSRMNVSRGIGTVTGSNRNLNCIFVVRD